MVLVIGLVVNRMRKTLMVKLSSSYVLITIICVGLITFFANLFLDRQFKNFVIKQQEKENKSIVEDINHQYSANGEWNIEVINKIGLNAIDEGLFITIKDISGNTVWDASTYNYDKCEIVKEKLTSNMIARYPNWKAMYTKDQYDIINNSNKVGTTEIGYFGPFYYTDNEILYINTLNRIVVGVGLMALLIALGLGLIMARGLSMPILSVTDTAKLIASGNYNQRVTKNTDIEELNDLILTINNLGSTLNEQEALRRRLTKDVSHELRTPLTTLHSHIEAMIDGLWEPTTERLKSCEEEVKRLKRLVGDLENLTKYESENLKLYKTKFNIADVIKNIVLNFENESINKGVKLTFDGKNTTVFADRDKISQVIINLLSNALKYTHNGDEIRISIDEDKEYTIISVKDTGIGISEKDLPYIFERFYRADESRNRKTGGAGIGLTIAKAIVDAHGGKISVESKLGEGTEFIVKLLKG
jgi:two-component system sensor histidine kinase BaeS